MTFSSGCNGNIQNRVATFLKCRISEAYKFLYAQLTKINVHFLLFRNSFSKTTLKRISIETVIDFCSDTTCLGNILLLEYI